MLTMNKLTPGPRSIQTTQAKKKRVIELYRQTNGHITNSCKAAGVGRKTYYDWLEKDEKFALAIAEAEAELNDEMRQVLIDKAGSGDMTAVIFYLKYRHPDFKKQPTLIVNQQFNKYIEGEQERFDV